MAKINMEQHRKHIEQSKPKKRKWPFKVSDAQRGPAKLRTSRINVEPYKDVVWIASRFVDDGKGVLSLLTPSKALKLAHAISDAAHETTRNKTAAADAAKGKQ